MVTDWFHKRELRQEEAAKAAMLPAETTKETESDQDRDADDKVMSAAAPVRGSATIM